MMALEAELMKQDVWFEQFAVEEAEYKYQQYLCSKKSKKSVEQGNETLSTTKGKTVKGSRSGLAQQIAQARQKIKESYSTTADSESTAINANTDGLHSEIKEIRESSEKVYKLVSDMSKMFSNFESRISRLESLSTDPAKLLHEVQTKVSKTDQGHGSVSEKSPPIEEINPMKKEARAPLRKDICISTLSESLHNIIPNNLLTYLIVLTDNSH